MTTDNPTVAGPKPAVISLDARRRPCDALAVARRRNAESFRRMAIELEGSPAVRFAPTAKQLAELEARTARLRDRAALLEDLRIEFAPIAAAIAKTARIATKIDGTLRAGEAPTPKQLRDLVRVTNAIANGTDLAGNGLRSHADEAWQAAEILGGKLVVTDNGEVVSSLEQIAGQLRADAVRIRESRKPKVAS